MPNPNLTESTSSAEALRELNQKSKMKNFLRKKISGFKFLTFFVECSILMFGWVLNASQFNLFSRCFSIPQKMRGAINWHISLLEAHPCNCCPAKFFVCWSTGLSLIRLIIISYHFISSATLAWVLILLLNLRQLSFDLITTNMLLFKVNELMRFTDNCSGI